MAKYVMKNKPEIEAIQFIMGGEVPALDFLGLNVGLNEITSTEDRMIRRNSFSYFRCHRPNYSLLVVRCKSNFENVNNTDYIIKDSLGNFSIMDQETFKNTYEKAEE